MNGKEFIKAIKQNKRILRAATSRVKAMQEIVDELKTPYKELIEIHFIQGRPLWCVSKATGFSEDGLPYYKSKALEKLEALLLKHGWMERSEMQNDD